jgi:proline iminopeptidase
LVLAASIVFLAAGCAKTEAPPEPPAASTAAVPQASRGTVSVDGIELPYFIEGTGIPCLVINNARAMSRALSQELRKTFQFIFTDMRAMVPYTKTYDLEKVTLDTFLDDIELVRAAVGIDKVCVFGHSIGGLFALEYVRKYPQHATHVVMNGTPAFYNDKFTKLVDEFWEANASDERKAILKQNVERMKEAVAKEPPGRKLIANYIMNGPLYFYDPKYDCAWLFEGEYWSPELFDRIFSVVMKGYDIAERQIPSVPIFLSLGRYDGMPYVSWDGIKEKFPNLSYNLFEKSGHYAPLEEQELFDKKLVEWIKSH